MFQKFIGAFIFQNEVIVGVVYSYDDSEKPITRMMLSLQGISLTNRFINIATKDKYGYDDLYEEALPVSPDSQPSSPTFSDKCE